MKKVLKFIIKKEYREKLYSLEKAGKIEKIETSSKHANKKFLILQRKNKDVGVFSDYIVFLRLVEYSIEKGYIPVIDRKTYQNIFFRTDIPINTWECFFEQPMKYTLEDVDYENAEVYKCDVAGAIYPVSIMHCKNKATINYWRTIARDYLRFEKKIYEKMIRKCESILGNSRCLGVAIREGYTKLAENEPLRLQGHPVQASVEDMLEVAEKYMKLWKCDKVFYTCQTRDTEEMFNKRFGHKAISYNRKRPEYKNLVEGGGFARCTS